MAAKGGKKRVENDRMVLNQTELKAALSERKKVAKKTCKCPECGHEFENEEDETEEEPTE